MPKKVDHDARRREIADALLRLAATEGLESVSLRHVAAEAGVSMGAVQHYFRSKDEMLEFALEHQSRRREERIAAKLRARGEPSPREILRTILVEVLPTDDRSRSEWLVGIAYFIRALREPRLAAVMAEGVPQLLDFFTGLLDKARAAGGLRAGADTTHEAAVLWALLDSQSTAIVLGQRTPAEAEATIDYYLDALFGPAARSAAPVGP